MKQATPEATEAAFEAAVAQAGGEYEAGQQRNNAALSGVNLMKKGPKGSPGNLANVQLVVEALRASRGR